MSAHEETWKYPMKRSAIRVKDGEWFKVKVEVRLNREGQRVFTLGGESGYLATDEQVDEQAMQSLEEYYAERNPDVDTETIEKLARIALSYGDTGGVEVVGDHGDKLLVLTGAGCQHEEAVKWFPEVEPYVKWHLNYMRRVEGSNDYSYEELPLEVIEWVWSFDLPDDEPEEE